MKFKAISWFVAAVLQAVAPSVAAQTYRELVDKGSYVSTGNCKIYGQDLSCDLFQQSGKEYLIVYNNYRRPFLVIRREDGIVVWTAANIEA